MQKRFFIGAMFTTLWLSLLPGATGCTDEPPDTSAPERIEIDRGADWQSALLYIADKNGPVEGWGSIRIYDNVSGFVEESIEQTAAAAPSDMFVTPDGSSMYVASSANGVIDMFRWNGNNWIDSGVKVETPTSSVLALVPGPDGKLYAACMEFSGWAGGLFIFDRKNDKLTSSFMIFPGLLHVTGIAWSPEGNTAYIAGKGPEGSQLYVTSWPSTTIEQKIPVPVQEVHEVVTSPDGRSVFVMAQGQIVIIDATGRTVAGTFKPSPEPDEDYYDAAFSKDGKYMFVTGTAPGKDGTLYVIEIGSKTVVHTVRHMGVRPSGIQRVE